MSLRIQKKIFGRLKQIFDVETPDSLATVSQEIQPIWNAALPYPQEVNFILSRNSDLPAFDINLLRLIDDNSFLNAPPAVNARLLDSILIRDLNLAFTNLGGTQDGEIAIEIQVTFENLGSTRISRLSEFTVPITNGGVAELSEPINRQVNLLARYDKNNFLENGIQKIEIVGRETTGNDTGIETTGFVNARLNWRYDFEVEINDKITEKFGI